jgi:hypothetical protein
VPGQPADELSSAQACIVRSLDTPSSLAGKEHANVGAGFLRSGVKDAIGRISGRAGYFPVRIPGKTRIIPASSSAPADQFAELELTVNPVAPARWVGVAVRVRDGGQGAYVGICKTSHGKSELLLCKRIGGKWIRLGRAYRTAPFVDGTRLRLVALGPTIAFMENGVTRIAACDKSLPDGLPGVLVNGAQATGKFSAGPAFFETHHIGDDSSGIATYSVVSAANPGSPRLLRVLRPTRPNLAAAHNFLFVLPVEEGLKSVYGNGLEALRSLNVHDEYNVTIIEPSFGIEPWYADNPDEPGVRHETFLVKELTPWVRARMGITGHEQNWLIGLSKSGLGGQALLLKHPDLFDLAASWDFPADMSAYDEFGLGSAACYGTDANFQANYRLTPRFVAAHGAPFRQARRIWIGQGPIFATNVARYESVLAAGGVRYAAGTVLDSPHRWDGGWLAVAMAALRECGVELARTAACDI